MNSEITTALTKTEERALALLGRGHEITVVHNATGLSEERLKQLLADPTFANRIAEDKFKHIVKHDDLDANYDEVELNLVERLKKAIPLMYKPTDLLRAIQVINGAKRRGATAPKDATLEAKVVPLLLPTAIIQHFSVNSANQVVRAGEQSLVTIQSGALDDILKKRNTKAIEYVQELEPLAAPEGFGRSEPEAVRSGQEPSRNSAA